MKALIVDDERDIGAMLVKILNREGYETTYVDSITGAKELIAQLRHDYYLLDLNLPDGSGFDLIPQIKSQQPRAKVVIISAYDSKEELDKANSMKVDRFISKPFRVSQVLEILAELR